MDMDTSSAYAALEAKLQHLRAELESHEGHLVVVQERYQEQRDFGRFTSDFRTARLAVGVIAAPYLRFQAVQYGEYPLEQRLFQHVGDIELVTSRAVQFVGNWAREHNKLGFFMNLRSHKLITIYSALYAQETKKEAISVASHYIDPFLTGKIYTMEAHTVHIGGNADAFLDGNFFLLSRNPILSSAKHNIKDELKKML